jgi:DMSO/TMAO reductase YedYZ heme-binding membrane subunit
MSKNYTPIITLAEEREEFASMLFQTLAYGASSTEQGSASGPWQKTITGAYLVVSSLSIHLLWKRRTGPGGVMLLLYTCITAVLVCVWYVSTMRKAAYDFVDIRHAPPFAEDYLCTPANLISEISSSLVVFNSDLLMVSSCRLRFLVRIRQRMLTMP